jgi:hypothetical protein
LKDPLGRGRFSPRINQSSVRLNEVDRIRPETFRSRISRWSQVLTVAGETVYRMVRDSRLET